MPTVIEGAYFRDIGEQPGALQATLETLVPSPTLHAKVTVVE